MIVRIWTGEARDVDAEEFRQAFYGDLLPRLRAVKGFLGVEVLERVARGLIEFVVISKWDSIDAIRAYAGHHEDRAVLEPDARGALVRFDETVKHYVRVAEEGP